MGKPKTLMVRKVKRRVQSKKEVDLLRQDIEELRKNETK